MLIGALSKQTGLSRETIRFYEKSGLLRSRSIQAGTRFYKDFEPDSGERLERILHAKKLGFTLGELKHLLDGCSTASDDPQRQRRLIETKLQEIADKMHKLRQIETLLNQRLELLPDSPD